MDKPKEVIHVRAKRGQATDSHSLAERVYLHRLIALLINEYSTIYAVCMYRSTCYFVLYIQAVLLMFRF